MKKIIYSFLIFVLLSLSINCFATDTLGVVSGDVVIPTRQTFVDIYGSQITDDMVNIFAFRDSGQYTKTRAYLFDTRLPKMNIISGGSYNMVAFCFLNGYHIAALQFYNGSWHSASVSSSDTGMGYPMDGIGDDYPAPSIPQEYFVNFTDLKAHLLSKIFICTFDLKVVTNEEANATNGNISAPLYFSGNTVFQFPPALNPVTEAVQAIPHMILINLGVLIPVGLVILSILLVVGLIPYLRSFLRS